jgi:hypothetical protein
VTIQQVLLAAGVTPVYATWNPSDKDAAIALSSGNLTLTATPTGSNTACVRATIGKTSGKWYWEITVSALSGIAYRMGVADSTHSLTAALTTILGDDSQEAWSIGGGAGSTVYSILLDMDNHTLDYWIDGVDGAVNYDISTGMTGAVYPCISATATGGSRSVTSAVNFGASAFSQTMPAGYQRLFT